MIITLAFIFLLGFLVTFLLTPVLRFLCVEFGFLDFPSRRKVHAQATPRLGGVAVIIAFCACLIYLVIFKGSLIEALVERLGGFCLSVAVLMLAGLWDDLAGIRPILKLLAQLGIALILFLSNLRVEFFTNPLTGAEVQLPFFVSMLLTISWIVGMINAVNLIDGLDGLAPGIVFISGGFLMLSSLYLENTATAMLLAILCGCTLGFLYHNFPPAKIFLGDTGSMFLGLILAVTALIGFQHKVVTATALIVPICAMAIPIYDTFLAIWRRFLKEGSVFIADKKHLHHRFLQLGLTQRQVVVAFYLATFYFGILSFLFVLLPNQYALLLLLLLGFGLFFAIKTIAFIERKIRKVQFLEKQLRKNE